MASRPAGTVYGGGPGGREEESRVDGGAVSRRHDVEPSAPTTTAGSGQPSVGRWARSKVSWAAGAAGRFPGPGLASTSPQVKRLPLPRRAGAGGAGQVGEGRMGVAVGGGARGAVPGPGLGSTSPQESRSPRPACSGGRVREFAEWSASGGRRGGTDGVGGWAWVVGGGWGRGAERGRACVVSGSALRLGGFLRRRYLRGGGGRRGGEPAGGPAVDGGAVRRDGGGPSGAQGFVRSPGVCQGGSPSASVSSCRLLSRRGLRRGGDQLRGTPGGRGGAGRRVGGRAGAWRQLGRCGRQRPS